MSSIKKENRQKKAAKHQAEEEAKARKVIQGIVIALIILGIALVALLSL
jgi:hypothetical protein